MLTIKPYRTNAPGDVEAPAEEPNEDWVVVFI
jgi:hypothetical protein